MVDMDKYRIHRGSEEIMEWNNTLDYEDKKYNLKQLGFKDEDINSRRNLDWNNLSKDMQKALYIYSHQTLESQNPLQNELRHDEKEWQDMQDCFMVGKKWVFGYIKMDGTYVRGYCKHSK